MAKVFEVTATTIAALKSFIQSKGPGTYMLNNNISVNANVTFGAESNGVRIVCPSEPSLDSSAIKFVFTGSYGITISAMNMAFEHCAFVASSPSAYTSEMIKILNSHMARFYHCDFVAGKGTAIVDDGSFGTHIVDPLISLYGSDGVGVLCRNHSNGMTIDGACYGRGIYDGGVALLLNGAEGLVCNNVMSYQTRHGCYIQPSSNNSVFNCMFNGSNFDTTHDSGSCVSVKGDLGAYSVGYLMFNNCWMYSNPTGGPCFNIQRPVECLSIVGGFARCDNGAYPWYSATIAPSRLVIAHVVPNAP